MKPNTTALDAVLTARDEDIRDVKSLDFFSFAYNGIEVSYHGRYYGYASPVGSGYHDEEFGAYTFDEMLDCRIGQTGKTIREMLSELSAADVSIDQSDFRREDQESVK
ncbi:MAG: hypothetical protein IJV65_00345 [Kiritimatiellae bacterium]|nr:hypothetical protein [Kiritimatiellia bacterium]